MFLNVIFDKIMWVLNCIMLTYLLLYFKKCLRQYYFAFVGIILLYLEITIATFLVNAVMLLCT